MEMKHLNNSQLILLTLLVSFVTSIATGITTVALIEQAPTSVTQTINKVIRETVEKVTPGEDNVKTVIVKEEDIIVDAIKVASRSIVTVYDGETVFAAGILINNGKTILLNNAGVSDQKQYTIKKGDDMITGIATSFPKGYAFIELKEKASMPAVTIAQKEVELGQTAIILSGTRAVPGTVTGIERESGTLEWSNPVDVQYLGNPVIDSNGSLIGIVLKHGERYAILSAQQLN